MNEITTIGLDLAKNIFQFTALMHAARSLSVRHCAVARC